MMERKDIDHIAESEPACPRARSRDQEVWGRGQREIGINMVFGKEPTLEPELIGKRYVAQKIVDRLVMRPPWISRRETKSIKLHRYLPFRNYFNGEVICRMRQAWIRSRSNLTVGRR
jgi:hypothetical protein